MNATISFKKNKSICYEFTIKQEKVAFKLYLKQIKLIICFSALFAAGSTGLKACV
jgi:hypothetical protein